jgi:hypothetical protein
MAGSHEFHQRAMLPGLPSDRITRIAVFPFSAFPLVLIGWIVVASNIKSHESGALVALYFTLLIGAVVLLVLSLAILAIGEQKSFREARAGYTLLAARAQHLEQLDSASGVIVRAAGDPFLGQEQLKAVRQAIRESGLTRMEAAPVQAGPPSATARAASPGEYDWSQDAIGPDASESEPAVGMLKWPLIGGLGAVVAVAVVAICLLESTPHVAAVFAALGVTVLSFIGVASAFALLLVLRRVWLSRQLNEFKLRFGTRAVTRVWVPSGTVFPSGPSQMRPRPGSWATLVANGETVLVIAGTPARTVHLGPILRREIRGTSKATVHVAGRSSVGVRIDVKDSPSIFLGAAGVGIAAPFGATAAEARALELFVR